VKRKVLLFLRHLVVALLLLVGLALATIYGLSERILRQRFDVAGTAVALPTDAGAIERGRHVALTRGCLDCHGEKLQGHVFFDQPHVARLTAPNLALLAREMPVEQLERSIRRGVNARGTTVRSMPSDALYNLTDADLGDLIVYLRSVPVTVVPLPETEIRLLGRVGLATGKFELPAERIARAGERPSVDPGDPMQRGRYIAATACAECHGADLRGKPDFPTPDLAKAAAYTPEQFHRLMATGEPAIPRQLYLMDRVARARFSHLTADEVTALHTYLGSLSGSGHHPAPPAAAPAGG
jgi:mono/diheme cytochrome c family protein